MAEYLMAGQVSEVDRLRLQSRVWEPAGQRLLAGLGDGSGKHALDVGCGALGWLRLLSTWAVGGRVTGTDIDPQMLELAEQFAGDEGLSNVEVFHDDLFDSQLTTASFDLVHARFQIAPIGRAVEQVRSYLRLVRPGGLLILEDPDAGSWHYNPDAPALTELIAQVLEAFRRGGGDFDAGRRLPDLLRRHGLAPEVHAETLALTPGHPYLRLPLQFSASLRPRLLQFVDEQHLDEVRARAEQELDEPGRWGTTFTLVQAWATVAAS